MSVSFVEPNLKKLRNDTNEPNVIYTTLSNTNSNSMLFRKGSDSDTDGESYYSARPRLTSRKHSTTSTVSSLSIDSPFQKRISFDTIPQHNQPTSSFFSRSSNTKNVDGLHASFSVSSKHQNHCTTYWSRSFLCSMSSLNNSRRALEWLVKNVMENGDELICLKVVHSDAYESRYQKEAEDIMKTVLKTVDPALQIKIIVEVAVGSLKQVVRKTMLLYQPSLVVVGTTAKTYSNVMRYMTKKTLSNYLLNHSPVPVIVILPDLIKPRSESTSTFSDPISTASSINETTPSEPFNYLMNLVNRPTLEHEDIEFRPTFNYTSLLSEPTVQDEVQRDGIEVVDAELQPFKSRTSIGSMTRPVMAQPTKEKKWSVKFLTKGLRRFSEGRS